jgi:hypothetical protein
MENPLKYCIFGILSGYLHSVRILKIDNIIRQHWSSMRQDHWIKKF